MPDPAGLKLSLPLGWLWHYLTWHHLSQFQSRVFAGHSEILIYSFNLCASAFSTCCHTLCCNKHIGEMSEDISTHYCMDIWKICHANVTEISTIFVVQRITGGCAFAKCISKWYNSIAVSFDSSFYLLPCSCPRIWFCIWLHLAGNLLPNLLG